MQKFMSDSDVVDRDLGHVANDTTNRGEDVWQGPVVKPPNGLPHQVR